MGRRKKKILSPGDWENLPDAELLQIRIQDLGLRIEESPIEPCIARLYTELDDHGISFHPPCYLSDEWLCPDKVPVIGIPFYLAHPRLKQLEQRMMFEVEGGTDASCMELLRHEAGHALNYAYRLFQRTRWRELFGPFSAKYSDSYESRPYSKRYVIHLRGNYAQAHPDEDFAETFAVWLAPTNSWEEKYRDWPAIRKLLYVDRVMRRVDSKPPSVTTRETPWSAARMRSTLEAYYQRRRRHLGKDFPGFYDPALQRLFSPEADSGEKASKLLRRFRRQIIDGVSTWTGERKYNVHSLFKKLIQRCDKLRLFTRKGETETVSEVTAFVTAVMGDVNRIMEDYKDR